MFEVGETIKIRGKFRNSAGALTDPDTVTLAIRQQPSGATSTYTYALGQVTKESTGIYYKEILLATDGTWSARWTVTGAVQSAKQKRYEVKESDFD